MLLDVNVTVLEARVEGVLPIFRARFTAAAGLLTATELLTLVPRGAVAVDTDNGADVRAVLVLVLNEVVEIVAVPSD